ncbi:hypothetical protein, partial [Adonisia turfae]|uniref:hypothetical protein n=1 Tax=Adonisia turfae TaxID=2950184 RepID=UPI002029AEF3
MFSALAQAKANRVEPQPSTSAMAKKWHHWLPSQIARQLNYSLPIIPSCSQLESNLIMLIHTTSGSWRLLVIRMGWQTVNRDWP